MTPKTPVMIVTGPVGVGKTTVAGAIADHLESLGYAHAFVDMDCLRSCYPRPADDPFHVELGLRNLGAVGRNFQAAGAGRLVLTDVVETPDLSPYHRAVPNAEIVVVRLTASPAAIEARLHRRETGAGLAWHLARAVELAALLERNGIGDLVVDTNEGTPEQLAWNILTRTRWAPGRA